MSEVHHCFPPVVTAQTRLLILGSLPGAASLAAGHYYENPRNQFWNLLETVIEQPLVELGYDARLDALRAVGIGLWDAVAAANRPGSLDADIRLHSASDISALAATLPQLRAIAFNGGTAARIGRRQIVAGDAVLIDLPSSSPAYTLSFASKAEVWTKLRAYLA